MSDLISRQAAIDALDVLCQEHRYKIPGKAETYSQYNEAWQDALDRAEGAIGNLPSAQPEPSQVARDIATIIENEKDMRVIAAQPEIIRCKDCIHKPTTNGARYGYAVTYPDDVCPFSCDDGYYNSMPPSDDFYCGYGERNDNG